MNRTLQLSLLTSALILVLSPAQAGTPINETRAVDADATISVSNIKGSIKITAWDKSEVAISGTLGEGAKELAIEGSGARLSIEVKAPESGSWFSWGGSNKMEDTHLEIKLPRKAMLEADSVSADVNVAGLEGRSVEIDSVSGDVRVEAKVGTIQVASVSGDVIITGGESRMTLESVSGDITATGVSGEASLESVSGRIKVEAQRVSDVDASTVSGDIELRAAIEAGGSIDVESMSGEVALFLPADSSVSVEAESFSGSVESDFGAAVSPEHGPGSSLEFKIGTGAGRISLESFSGDLEIRKQ